MYEENLTNLQKIALRGEVAYILSTSSSDAEIKYRIYLTLKKVDYEQRPLYIEAFKEAVTFSEDEFNRLILESQTDELPFYLWINKTIEDLKLPLRNSEAFGSYLKLSIDKNAQKKKLIESAFISFTRKALIICPKGARQLCNAVLADDELEFLHISCLSLKDGCNEVEECAPERNDFNQVFNMSFNLQDFMTLDLESKTLECLQEFEEKKKLREEAMDEISKDNFEVQSPKNVETIVFEGSVSPQELSEFISKKILEHFSSKIEKEQPVNFKQENNARIKYTIQRTFKTSDLVMNIMDCDTEEEAKKYIEGALRDNPEIKETGDLTYIKKRIN